MGEGQGWQSEAGTRKEAAADKWGGWIMAPPIEFVISPLIAPDEIEIVERKGAGHPDTICDALAETFSINLCPEYQRRVGTVLHHNVDKALLRGGRTPPCRRLI